MMTTNGKLIGSPYIGPRAFEFKERRFFCGRENETDILTSLVIAHRVSLLYAQSGAGKSSLIRAGLIPNITRKSWIGWGEDRRLSRMMNVLPILTVGNAIPRYMTESIDNVFVFSALLVLLPTVEVNELASMSLSTGISTWLQEREAERTCKADVAKTKLERPDTALLIFDQFEEIFTRHIDRWPEREGFFQQVTNTLQAHPNLHLLFLIYYQYIHL